MADGMEFDFSKVLSELDMTQKIVNRGINQAVKKSAIPLQEEIVRKTPYSTEERHKYNEGHAKDNVVTTNVKGGMTDEKYVEVGYNSKVAWRMYFVEFGTTKQKPQRIVSGAIKTQRSKILKIQADETKRMLGL